MIEPAASLPAAKLRRAELSHERPSGKAKEKEHGSLTTLGEKLMKIGARIVRHGRYVVFQLAEVGVPRSLFAEVMRRIDRLRPRPAPLPA
jgi:hypothetical protein